MAEKILLDTNIPLEIILGQSNADVACALLESSFELAITDFAIYSLFIVCRNRGVDTAVLTQFYKLLSENSELLVLSPEDLIKVYEVSETKGLDFDDAHIYYMAGKSGAKAATFDSDLLKYKGVSVHPSELVEIL